MERNKWVTFLNSIFSDYEGIHREMIHEILFLKQSWKKVIYIYFLYYKALD